LTDEYYAKYHGIKNINKNFPSPNVSTHCLYGVGVDTPESFHYTKPFPKGATEDPEVTMGDGDGAVNLKSSEVCLHWAHNNGGHSFKSMTFNRVDHRSMLRNKDVLGEIGSIVGASIK
jgi:lysophospholipase-3